MQYCAEAVMESSADPSREQDPWLIVGAYMCTYGPEWILHAHGALRAPDSVWEQFLRYKQRKERVRLNKQFNHRALQTSYRDTFSPWRERNLNGSPRQQWKTSGSYSAFSYVEVSRNWELLVVCLSTLSAWHPAAERNLFLWHFLPRSSNQWTLKLWLRHVWVYFP